MIRVAKLKYGENCLDETYNAPVLKNLFVVDAGKYSTEVMTSMIGNWVIIEDDPDMVELIVE